MLSWILYIWFVDISLMNFEFMFISKLNCFFAIYQFSHSVMSNSLWSHGLQHAGLPCPSPTPRACSNSCPSNLWCHPTISSSVVPFSSCPQSFPASGSFQMSQSFPSGGQSIGVSASESVLPMNIQDWSPLGWTGWISLLSEGRSRVFSNSTVQKHQFFSAQPFFGPTLTSIHDTGKTAALTMWTFVGKVMSPLFNMLSRWVTGSLLSLEASLYFMAAATLRSDFVAQETEVAHCFRCFPIFFPWSDGTGCHDLRFLNVEL